MVKRAANSKRSSVRRKRKRRIPQVGFNYDRFKLEGSWIETLTHPIPCHPQDCGAVVYVITSSDYQGECYVGKALHLPTRWLQHSGLKDKSKSAVAAGKWRARGEQPEPVCVIQGFASVSDCLAFENLVQDLNFRQFKNVVPYQWQRCKDERGKTLRLRIRKMLVALCTTRWRTQPLKILWYNTQFRPRQPGWDSMLPACITQQVMYDERMGPSPYVYTRL